MPIKPIPKKRKKLPKISTLRNKADKLYQEAGRKLYDTCLVCPKPMVCLHHYYTKGSCSALRYEFDNGIPLCAGCHLKHHTGNPDIQNAINFAMGDEWLKELKIKKREPIKTNREYYNKVIEDLKTYEQNK